MDNQGQCPQLLPGRRRLSLLLKTPNTLDKGPRDPQAGSGLKASSWRTNFHITEGSMQVSKGAKHPVEMPMKHSNDLNKKMQGSGSGMNILAVTSNSLRCLENLLNNPDQQS